MKITCYDRIQDPIAGYRALGEDIARSKLLGCENIEQGRILGLTCIAKRISPLELAERYDIIQGRLSMKAQAMLADFLDAGGTHKIVARDENLAEVHLTMNGQTYVSRLSWEEAEAEGMHLSGKGKIKENWSTPRKRTQMMWARVISDGIRTLDPRIVCGKYTAEELGDETTDHDDQIIESDEIEVEAEPAKQEPNQLPQPQPQQQLVEHGELGDDYATGQQIQAILDLYVALNVAFESQQAALEKRGVSSLRHLKKDQAAEILQRLQLLQASRQADKEAAEESARQQADEAGGQSQADPEATAQPMTGPATEVQIETAKRLLTEMEQIQPGTVGKMKERLQAAGLQKIADMTAEDCNQLIQGLQKRNLEMFWGRELGVPY